MREKGKFCENVWYEKVHGINFTEMAKFAKLNSAKISWGENFFS